MARAPSSQRSEEAEAHWTRLLEGLLAIDQAALSQTELEGRLEILLDKILETLGLTAGAIRLSDGNGRTDLRAHRGLSPLFLNKLSQRQLLGDCPDISGIRTPIVIPDVARDSRFAHSLFQEEGIRSLIMMPIRAGELQVGSFALMSFSEERTLGEEDRFFLEEAGKRVGQAILNSQMFAETKRQKRGLSLLFSVSQAVGQTLALDEMLQRALDALLHEWGCLFAAAYLTKEGDPFHAFELAQSRGMVKIPFGLWEAMGDEASSVRARIAAVLAGETSEVSDLAREHFESSTLLWGGGIRSLALIPIKKQAQLLGVILLGGRARLLSEKGSLDLMATVGAQLAIGIENARLYRKAEQRVADLTALQMIGLEVGSTLSQGKVMELIAETVDELLGPHNVNLLVLEQDSDVLKTLAYRGKDPDPSYWEHIFRSSDPRGVLAWVARTGEPAVIPDVSSDPRYVAWFPEVRSEIAVPIFAQGKVLGVLSAESEWKGAFGDNELRLLTAVAGQAGIALENARLFEEAQHRIAELTALQRISTGLGSASEEKHVAQVIVETVEELLGTHHVSLLTRVPGTDRFRVLAIVAQAASELFDPGEPSASDEVGVISWVARNAEPLIVNDTRREPRYRAIVPGILSEIAVPVLSRREVIGVINAESEQPNAFNEHTLRMLTIVANQAQVALENARLFSQARRKIANLTALHEIGLEITSTLGVDQILERIVDIVVGSLKPYDCAFYSLHPEEEPRELVLGPSFPGANGSPLPSAPDVIRIPLAGPGVVAWVAREGCAAFLPRVQEDSRYLKVFEEVVSEIAVPLLAKGKVIGVLNVETDRPEAFSAATLEFLNTIAQQASVAIENARLYEMLEQNYFDTVRTLVLAMDAKDPYTRGHSERVRRYAVELAAALGMSEEEAKRVSYAGLLHDIGKIGVREDILLKPGDLTPEEFEEVKLHSVVGGKLVDNVALLKGVGPLIRSEHEYYSGGGYPDGLAGEVIPLGARVIAVADAYDAMTTDRAYHQAMSPEDALQELRACAGRQFDPRVVEALVHIVTGGKRE